MRVEAVPNNIVELRATTRFSNYELINLSSVTSSKQIQTQIWQPYYRRAHLIIVDLVMRPAAIAQVFEDLCQKEKQLIISWNSSKYM